MTKKHSSKAKQIVAEADAAALATLAIDPVACATMTASLFVRDTFGSQSDAAMFNAVGDRVSACRDGNLTGMKELLASQAISLNTIFVELSRRSALNLGQHLEASERYMRLALKAQAQSRATIEAIDRLTNGREQTVRHVHVDNRGGQAVIAENVHVGGERNETADKQPHAIAPAHEPPSTALRRNNSEWKPVPINPDG